MRFFEYEQQSTSFRTSPPQHRNQPPSTQVLKPYLRPVSSQTFVRGAGGSGRPSGSSLTSPPSLIGSPEPLIRRPRLSIGRPSLRNGKPLASIRGNPCGCGQDPVVKMWPQKW